MPRGATPARCTSVRSAITRLSPGHPGIRRDGGPGKTAQVAPYGPWTLRGPWRPILVPLTPQEINKTF